MELSYPLDESEEGSIAVNVLPLLLASRNSATSKEKSDRYVKKNWGMNRVCEQKSLANSPGQTEAAFQHNISQHYWDML